MYDHICECLQRPEENIGFMNPGFIGDGRLFDKDAGNWSLVFYKSSKYS